MGGLGAVGWLAAGALLPFAWSMAGRDVFFLSDALHHHFPVQRAFDRLLAAAPAALPAWNPWSFAGAPFIADPQSLAWYPPAVLYRVLPFASAYGCFLALHAFLAFAGTAVFLRSRGTGPAAAWLAGAGFALGASPACLLTSPPVFAARAWLPWIALGAVRLARHGRARDGALLGLLFGWQWLAGYPPAALHGAVLAGVIWAFLRPRGTAPWRAFAAAAATAAAASAAQLVPFLWYLPDTNRGGALPAAAAAAGAASPWELLGFLTPWAVLPVSRLAVVGAGPQWPTLHASGALALALAVTGAVLLKGRRDAAPALALGALGAALALGPWLPGLGPLLLALPPFSWMRHAGLWLVLTEFALAWLAGLGAEAAWKALKGRTGVRLTGAWGTVAVFLASAGAVSLLTRHWTQVRWGDAAQAMAVRVSQFLHPAAALGAGLLVFWLVRRREIPARWGTPALAAVAWLECAVMLGSLQPVASAKALLDPPPAEAFLASRPGWFRVQVAPLHQVLAVEDGEGLDGVARNLRAALRSSLPAAAGLREAGGAGPLRPRGTEAILDRAFHDPETLRPVRSPFDPRAERAFRLLGVRYLITKRPLRGDAPRPVFSDRVRIYAVGGAGAPAWVEPAGAGTVRAASPAAGAWMLDADMRSAGTVVVSESFVSGWRAEGGADAKLAEAYGGLLGLALPAGRHAVTLRYRPWSIPAGLIASLAGLLALAVAGLFLLRR